MDWSEIVQAAGDDTLVRVKAVPNASRDAVAGARGDRLKIRVASPAEGGRANAAICRVLARALGIRPARVTVDAGVTAPEKVLRVRDVAAPDVIAAIRPDSG